MMSAWSPFSGLSEDRVLGLLSALPPSRSANRTAFDDKYNYYSRSINQLLFCLQTSASSGPTSIGGGVTRFSFRWDQSFHRRFQHNGLLPKCLPQVLMEMERKEALMALEKLLWPSTQAVSVVGNLFTAVWSGIVRPAAGFVYGLLFDDDDLLQATAPVHGMERSGPHYSSLPEGWYVSMERVKEVARQWLEFHKRNHANFYTDRILTVEELRRQLQMMQRELRPASTVASSSNPAQESSMWSDQDLDILIAYLQRIGAAAVNHYSTAEAADGRERMVIKLSMRGRQQSLHISQTDLGIATLKQTSQRLHTQNQQFEQKIQDLGKQIKDCLARKNRSAAQRLLIHQKSLAKQLDNRLAQLITLDGILLRMQQMESEAEVVQSFRVGAQTLQQWMRDKGMTVDRVEEAVQHVQDVFEDYAEVERAIEEHTMPAAELNEAELEAELEALLVDEQQQQQQLQQVAESLPAVPTTAPVTATESKTSSDSQTTIARSALPV